MRLSASCVFVPMLVAVVHPEHSDHWAGVEVDNKKLFAPELVESAFHGLDAHEYTPEKFTQFVKDRMDLCFPSVNASLFASMQPVVFHINWHVELTALLDSSSFEAAKERMAFGHILAFFVYRHQCSWYYWFLPGVDYFVFIEQRVVAKTETTVSTHVPAPVCDASLPEGRVKWCRRISYFFTRFKC